MSDLETQAAQSREQHRFYADYYELEAEFFEAKANKASDPRRWVEAKRRMREARQFWRGIREFFRDEVEVPEGDAVANPATIRVAANVKEV